MHPERWPRVESMFHDALRIPSTKRDAFARSECEGDECLYSEVTSLLRCHEAESLLDQGAGTIAAGWLLATTHELPSGSRIGPYEISGEIGRGGMGTVYRAKDTRLDRDIALKLVWQLGVGSPEHFPHFDREARAASALNHPNIITIHEVGSADGLPYIACEFVDGVTLRERLARGRMDVNEVISVGLQVAEALAVAHAAGIVHRDIKPENIMIRRDGLAKVLDFGVATLTGAGTAVGAARLAGTPRYMSSEQLRGAPADARSDVYSLGVVLYEMATGDRPRPAMTLAQLPSDLRDVVRRSVAADPAERYPSGSEMKAALEKVASGRRHRQRNLPNRLWLTLGALTILTAGLFAFLLSRPAVAPPSYYSAVPLTSEAGAQVCPSFSPDGKRVVFSWDGEGQDNFDIYVKQIGGGAPLRLTSDPRPDLSPAWSPDGRSIAFIRFSPDNTGEVLLMPSLGGRERRLAQVAAFYAGYRNLRMLAWSTDGKWLAVPDASTGVRSGLSLLSLETGEKRRLTDPPTTYDDFEPAFSPDGTHLAFVRCASAAAGDVYVLEMSHDMRVRGAPMRLTFDHRPNSSPVWTHDGRSLLFTRYDLPGRHSLWKITLSSPPRLAPVPISADNASALAISPRGDRLVYGRQTNNVNLWAVDVPAAESMVRARAVPRPWSISSREDATPSFSPDSRQVAFQSTRSGWSEIWTADRDGSHLRQLTDLKGAVAGFPHWSPDGKKIAFHSRQQSYARIFLLDLLVGRPMPLNYQAVIYESASTVNENISST